LVESPLPPPPPGATIAPLAAEVKHAGRTRSKSEWLSAGQGISGVLRYNARLIARTYRGAHSCATYGFGTFSGRSETLAPSENPLAGLGMAPPSAAKGTTRTRTVFEPRTSPKSPPYRTQVLRPVPARRRFSSSSS